LVAPPGQVNLHNALRLAAGIALQSISHVVEPVVHVIAQPCGPGFTQVTMQSARLQRLMPQRTE
jgi:hypothetical protein